MVKISTGGNNKKSIVADAGKFNSKWNIEENFI